MNQDGSQTKQRRDQSSKGKSKKMTGKRAPKYMEKQDHINEEDWIDEEDHHEHMALQNFSQENLSNIMNSAKPQRNIIKRYWTDEEVYRIN